MKKMNAAQVYFLREAAAVLNGIGMDADPSRGDYVAALAFPRNVGLQAEEAAIQVEDIIDLAGPQEPQLPYARIPSDTVPSFGLYKEMKAKGHSALVWQNPNSIGDYDNVCLLPLHFASAVLEFPNWEVAVAVAYALAATAEDV